MDGKGRFLSPYMGGRNYVPHQPGKTRLSPKHRNQWCGWITYARIDENPEIRGHDLCFDKTCQGNRLAKHAEVEQ